MSSPAMMTCLPLSASVPAISIRSGPKKFASSTPATAARQSTRHSMSRAQRLRFYAHITVRDDFIRGVTCIDGRLEHLHPLSRDGGAALAANQIFASLLPENMGP